MKNTKKGFTLVELLVVIAILAILASVAVVGYSAFLDNARNSNAKTELHQIVTYVNAELMDDGKWEFTVETTADDEETTGVDESVNTTYTVKVVNGELVCTKITDEANAQAADATINEVIEKCPDFADLKGEVTLKDGTDKTLVYTLTEGGSAEATLD